MKLFILGVILGIIITCIFIHIIKILLSNNKETMHNIKVYFMSIVVAPIIGSALLLILWYGLERVIKYIVK